MGTLRAATLPSKRIVLLEVKPRPIILATVPTEPALGESEYSCKEPVGQANVAIALRVIGPRYPVAAILCEVCQLATAAFVTGPK